MVGGSRKGVATTAAEGGNHGGLKEVDGGEWTNVMDDDRVAFPKRDANFCFCRCVRCPYNWREKVELAQQSALLHVIFPNGGPHKHYVKL